MFCTQSLCQICRQVCGDISFHSYSKSIHIRGPLRHLLANFCASSTCCGVITAATESRPTQAVSLPAAAAKLYHAWAFIRSFGTPFPSEGRPRASAARSRGTGLRGAGTSPAAPTMRCGGAGMQRPSRCQPRSGRRIVAFFSRSASRH